MSHTWPSGHADIFRTRRRTAWRGKEAFCFVMWLNGLRNCQGHAFVAKEHCFQPYYSLGPWKANLYRFTNHMGAAGIQWKQGMGVIIEVTRCISRILWVLWQELSPFLSNHFNSFNDVLDCRFVHVIGESEVSFQVCKAIQWSHNIHYDCMISE